MFGRVKDEKDNEIAEIKMGALNLFYVARITEKFKRTGKISREDITTAHLTDASEVEFKKILEDFIAENGDYDRAKFPFYVAKNGYYCIHLNKELLRPGQQW